MGTDNLAAALLAAPITFVGARDGFQIRLDLGSILGYILVGLIVGLIARLLVPGRDPVGILGTLAIGVIGAVLGGWLAGEFFAETEGVDWLASIGVAALLVLLLRAGSRRPTWSRR